ncbi:hypothetical protein [Streptomyces sp. SID5910]|uniref:hypothetical protein n=1 Tax=Streptomyces sp. SID5910 TaxID=2690312 RepID=UPI001371A748|nr:hypothetical protein [Streptomyces sp. SID5910]MYR41920.1 hypothetical protein [Streptomyces sp. SID5910]
MTSPQITPEERAQLDKALYDALNPLASALRSRTSGLPEERMWEGEPVEVALSVLTAWKAVDAEVKRLTAVAAGTAGSYGASYEQLGAAWGITRQGARKKWPEAVSRPAPASAQPGAPLELCGGVAELTQDPSSGGWRWAGEAADGTHGTADAGTWYTTKEEAAAHAGAFLRGHAGVRP